MTKQSTRTSSIAVVFTRPSGFGQEADWDQWYDEVHLPETAAASGAWVVTRWEVIDRPIGYSPPVGFTHVAIYEFDELTGRQGTGPEALLDLLDAGRSDGSFHPAHTITAAEGFIPVGAWRGRLEPRAACTGQVVAYVGPNDPAVIDEWSAWLDTVHVPDMMASGAFVDTSRWQRTNPARFGPNFFTIYDVELEDVADAVRLSGQAMGPAHDAGRVMEQHAGGIRAALRRTGRYGGAGYRP